MRAASMSAALTMGCSGSVGEGIVTGVGERFELKLLRDDERMKMMQMRMVSC
jgi:hypothetical protein